MVIFEYNDLIISGKQKEILSSSICLKYNNERLQLQKQTQIKKIFQSIYIVLTKYNNNNSGQSFKLVSSL